MVSAVLNRAFRFRLAPTTEQEIKLRQCAGVTRLIYNLALEQRRDWWRQYRSHTGSSLNFVSQGRQVTELRREYEWIGAVPSSCLHQALRDLDKAFANFFAGRAGYPSPRRKGANDSFRIQGKEIGVRPINRRWAAVRVPNIGWIKFRSTRAVVGQLCNVTIARDALGWHAIFACELEHESRANNLPAVGIDRGVATSLVLSTGETFLLPSRLAELDKRRRQAQRALSRCRRGSRRRVKRLRRVSRLSARIARIRADWQHRATRSIADRFGLVAMENLNIVGMVAKGRGKRGLNRAIHEQGWSSFATKLAYKLEELGGRLVLVNPAYTSQTCSECGAVDQASRKSQAAFACTSCGFTTNADWNAAIVILRRSTPLMPVEGSGCAPGEAGTMLAAA